MYFVFALIIVVGAVVAAAVGVFAGRGKHAVGAETRRFPRMDRTLAIVTAVLFVLLAATGLYATFTGERAMTGFSLLAHVGIGAAFAVVLVLLIVLRAEACMLDPAGDAATRANCPRYSPWQRRMFWLFALSCVILIVTAVLVMFPLFTPEQQHTLLEVHKWFALASVLAGGAYFALRFAHP